MANQFNKQETELFEQSLMAFEDAAELSQHVSTQTVAPDIAERSNNTVWIPEPYIATSFDGLDQSANFGDITQLSVPATIGYHKSVPFQMTAYELNDALQSKNFGKAAREKLASDINKALSDTVCLGGALVIKRGTPAGYDDVAEADSVMNEQGINRTGRKMLLHTRDYNAMASNLASRANVAGKVQSAYETGAVGQVAGFDTYEAGYTYRLSAATATGVTINGANQRYVPKATSTASTGQMSNVDNRTQVITITVTGSTVKVGDCFTIAGVESVHHITKQATGQLKTFRITEIVTGAGGSGTVKISPPIIAADSSPTREEQMYKNVSATPANGAAITFLNTVTANVSPFWVADAVKIIPGKVAIEPDAGLGVMRGSTKQGIELVMTKQAGINNLQTKYRFDVRFGTVLAQPEMAGIMLMRQT